VWTIQLLQGEMQCLHCSCEYGIEHFGSLKGGESLVHVRDCQFLRSESFVVAYRDVSGHHGWY
jgi:hypothetical protein